MPCALIISQTNFITTPMFTEICNTLLLYGLVFSLCAESDFSGPPSQDPDRGEVISTYCSGTTLIKEIADGQGGYASEETENSPECGYQKPPDLSDGELIRSGCSKDFLGVKWFQYSDGQGGTYAEKDTQSVECGWEPPTLVLELEKAEGDRFKPAIINVNYTNFLGEKEPWGMVDASTTLGHIERRGNNILVYGTGQPGEGIVTLGREEIQFTIVEEPRCGKIANGFVPDCQGYAYSGPEQGYIYYGDDDDQIVEWEIAYFIYDTEDPAYSSNHESHITELFEKGSEKWDEVQKIVDVYNDTYERSGIHIRYVLKEGNVGRMHYHGAAGLKSLIQNKTNADVGLGKGYTCPDTCGCAHVNKYFPENSNRAPIGLSVCNTMTDLHEIGHSVGLAHGPENSAYAASGYIWSEFGHGWASLCGRSFADIMSYNSGKRAHHNSRLTCGEMYGDLISGINPTSWGPWDDPAGYRDYADAAYHLNRIRYDVSLINCEDHKCADSFKADLKETEEDPLVLIEDKIYDFPDGLEQRKKELRRLERFNENGKLK